MVCQNSDTDYGEALEWLFSQLPMFSRIGPAAYKPGLETTERLDSLYGHPHKKFKTIHVGGTNGKGSTSHMIAACLQGAGYNVGLYTSPHLTDFRERMRINGKMIPKEAVVKFVREWKANDSYLRPSFFELTMMMAFHWFASEKVDYAVIEVGMGGRLDSTNIIKPVLSVITNISFDHTQFLGDTLEAIAGEKAGIIKKNTPVVVGEAQGGVREVFERKAAEERSRIVFASEKQDSLGLQMTDGGWEITLPDGSPARAPLGGGYQKKNIATAIAALEELRQTGAVLPWKYVVKGLEGVTQLTGLRGRWHKIGDKPDVICDTGHNADGISETMKTLAAKYPGKRPVFVIGFVNDKDVSHIVDLFPAEGEYIFTQASIPRAMPAETVARHFSNRGISGRVIPSVREAYAASVETAGQEDVIYVGGSTFVVADLLSFIEEA